MTYKLKNLDSIRTVAFLTTFMAPDHSFRDKEVWSFRLIESDSKSNSLFEATTIDELIINEGLNNFDLIKLDIEGGEAEVFKNGTLDWLEKQKSLQ